MVEAVVPQAVSLSFFRFGGAGARAWALAQMGLARPALARTPEIGFWKLCGSGTGSGFTPVPNTAVYAILATWPDHATARARVTAAPVWQQYRARAVEDSRSFDATSAPWGMVGGRAFHGGAGGRPGAHCRADAGDGQAVGRGAVLGAVPELDKLIGTDPNVAFKIGIGEVRCSIR